MKTTKKRIQKKSRPNKTRKRNVKRKSRKVTKTHKRKYRNKKYTGGGINDKDENEQDENDKDETDFGFDNPDLQYGIDEISVESMENIKTIFNKLSHAVNLKDHFQKYNGILDRQYYSKLLDPAIYEKNKQALVELNDKYNKFVDSVKNRNSFIPLNGDEVEIKTLTSWAEAFELLFAFTGQYDKYVYDSRTQGELTDEQKKNILIALGSHCKKQPINDNCIFPNPCISINNNPCYRKK